MSDGVHRYRAPRIHGELAMLGISVSQAAVEKYMIRLPKPLSFNVTQNPTAQWTAQQIVEAFAFDTAPRYLLRDRDSVNSEHFRRRVKSLGIKEVVTAPRSPWQSPYVERLIGNRVVVRYVVSV